MSRATSDLFLKLDLALKLANLSKGRLAFEIGVHKSLVGRWARGIVTPSEHNLSLVTEVLAKKFPDFSLATWALSWDDFSRRIGGKDRFEIASSPRWTSSGTSLSEAADTRFLSRAFAASKLSMGSERLNCLGVYLGFRHGLSMGGRLICDLYAIWREDEELRFGQWGVSFAHLGPVMVLRGQVYLIGEDAEVINSLFCMVLVGILGGRAVRMDGLILTVAGNHRLNSPSATKIVLQRIADLPNGDGRPDPTVLDRILQRIREVVSQNRIREHIDPSILSAICEPCLEAPGEPTLVVPTEKSLSRSEIECDNDIAACSQLLRRQFIADDSQILPMRSFSGAPLVF